MGIKQGVPVIEERLEEQQELYQILTERSFTGIYVVQEGKFRYLLPKRVGVPKMMVSAVYFTSR
jgi:hypothetical protein